MSLIFSPFAQRRKAQLKTKIIAARKEITTLESEIESIESELASTRAESTIMKSEIEENFGQTKMDIRHEIDEANKEIASLKEDLISKGLMSGKEGSAGILRKKKKDRKRMSFAEEVEEVEIVENEEETVLSTLDLFKAKKKKAIASETSSVSSVSQGMKKKTSARWESDNAKLTIVCDLDGTVLPRPYKDEKTGQVIHPKLSDGDVYQPLLELLERGASLVGVTGASMKMHKSRFWDCIPEKVRKEGRLLFFCETGMILYRPDEHGNPEEDESYGPFPGNEKHYLRSHTVESTIQLARLGIKEWFKDLKINPNLIHSLDENSSKNLKFLFELAAQYSEEEAPLTHDPQQTPRIELRGPSEHQVVGLMIAGIPTEYGDKYISSRLKPVMSELSGAPSGRLCYDCVVPGLSKHLVINYLLRSGMISRGSAFAIADSPSGNDEGLTKYHNHGIPFISVCSKLDQVFNKELHSCHIGLNDIGTSLFMKQLCETWDDMDGGYHRISGTNTGHLTLENVEKLVLNCLKINEKLNMNIKIKDSLTLEFENQKRISDLSLSNNIMTEISSISIQDNKTKNDNTPLFSDMKIKDSLTLEFENQKRMSDLSNGLLPTISSESKGDSIPRATSTSSHTSSSSMNEVKDVDLGADLIHIRPTNEQSIDKSLIGHGTKI